MAQRKGLVLCLPFNKLRTFVPLGMEGALDTLELNYWIPTRFYASELSSLLAGCDSFNMMIGDKVLAEKVNLPPLRGLKSPGFEVRSRILPVFKQKSTFQDAFSVAGTRVKS